MANDLNRWIGIGRLTKSVTDDERSFGYVGNGTAKAVVSIAVNRSVKKGDNWENVADFFDVTIWGKTAENLKPYLVKGQQIAFSAHLQMDRWEKDGQKFSKISIVADEVELLGGKKDGQNSSSAPQKQSTPSQQSFNPADGFPSDVPF